MTFPFCHYEHAYSGRGNLGLRLLRHPPYSMADFSQRQLFLSPFLLVTVSPFLKKEGFEAESKDI